MKRKLTALALAVVLVFSVSLALANTVEPEIVAAGPLAGSTVHATVGEYIEPLNAFWVTVYEYDRFSAGDVEGLAAGDILLADGTPCTVKEMSAAPEGEPMAVTGDGLEIVFTKDGDGYSAHFTDDDRQCMHAVAVLLLSPVEGIVYEDNSDPDLDAEMKVYEGLEAVLAAKAEKEETSIGFDFYATTVTLNENLEITAIHQDYDVAQ